MAVPARAAGRRVHDRAGRTRLQTVIRKNACKYVVFLIIIISLLYLFVCSCFVLGVVIPELQLHFIYI